MPVNRRDCSRTANSRRQLWTAFVRSNKTKCDDWSLATVGNTAKT
jgi:hypothetical protein